MAALESAARLNQIKNLLQPWTPMSATVRWRTRKPNVQRPLPPHYVKARILAATKPIYPDSQTGKPLYEVCIKGNKSTEEDNMYELLLAENARQNFLNSEMVAIFHENSTKVEEKLRIRGFLHGHDMKFVYGNKNVISRALAGTEMEPLLKLHVGTTCYLCCKDFNVKKLLTFTRKMPTLILLGGFVQGRLMTRNQLTWCSQLPDIGTLRAEFCSILSSATVNLSQNLSHHQMNLSRLLEEHTNPKNDSEWKSS